MLLYKYKTLFTAINIFYKKKIFKLLNDLHNVVCDKNVGNCNIKVTLISMRYFV